MYNYDRETNKNLVLVILFSEDKKVFIRTNKKSIKYYPDERCQEIIDFYMLPSFKNGDFFEGLLKGINELIIYKNI